jgi:hypothetical protein
MMSTHLLVPNYSVGCSSVMQNLVQFLFGGHVSAQSGDDREMAIIKNRFTKNKNNTCLQYYSRCSIVTDINAGVCLLR